MPGLEVSCAHRRRHREDATADFLSMIYYILQSAVAVPLFSGHLWSEDQFQSARLGTNGEDMATNGTIG